jgi:hypothetical protein
LNNDELRLLRLEAQLGALLNRLASLEARIANLEQRLGVRGS